jgi:hypothetical protein
VPPLLAGADEFLLRIYQNKFQRRDVHSYLSATEALKSLSDRAPSSPPSLHDHYSRFLATTRQSAPLRRIGTFGLAVGAAFAFSLTIAGQILPFRIPEPGRASRRLHAGCRLGIRTSPELIPKVGSTLGFDIT